MEQYWGCKSPEGQFNVQMYDEISGAESDAFNEWF